MASDSTPPDYNADDDSKNDDEMFASAISPSTANISLDDDDDDDDDNDKKATLLDLKSNQSVVQESGPTPSFSSTRNDQDDLSLEKKNKDESDDEDPFGTNKSSNRSSLPSATSAQVPSSSPQSPSSTPSQMYPNVPSSQTSEWNNQGTLSSPDYKADYANTEPIKSAPSRERVNEDDIEITVSDPTKIGDGMSSYMIYRITTKTTLTTFKKPEFSVSRRFSDFLGLHAKLIHKHLRSGFIIPSPPEKDAVGMAKVKISKDDNIPNDFVDRRRALLERYLNRLVKHDKLIVDPDVQEFLELDKDLPKAKETAALSGAGVMRAFTGIGNSVSKLTTKTNEQDQWFEERYTTIVNLQAHFKHMNNILNNVLSQRKDAGLSLRQYFTSLNHLATVEEHPSLSRALTELANLQEKLDQINNEHSYKEYSILTELIKEYISLLDMVQAAFNERIRIHNQWLNAEDTLRKRREEKIKLEQSPKGGDKLPQKEAEIHEWEDRVETSKQEFERISSNIKDEIEIFEQTRIDDFKKAIDNYLKNSLEQQEKILQLWEGYSPEVNQITA